MYTLLRLGGRNVHVTVYGRKECTCYCVWEEGMYAKRGRMYSVQCTNFYLPRLGGRNVLCCYCVRVKEICMLLQCLGGKDVLATVSGFVHCHQLYADDSRFIGLLARSEIFCDNTQHVVVISCRCFGTTYRVHFDP
jgi:hypothetical protein